MFDTMTGVKIVGGFCGALLLFLLAGWAASLIYYGPEGHGEAEQAYIIPVESGDASEDATEGETVPFEELFAAADPAAGEKLFRQCGSCHKLDGSNATGPHLDGVVGRAVGSVPDFSYSSAMAEHGGDWTPENLSLFIEDPSGYVPGTKMTYKGMKDDEDRANLIAYLQTVGS
jgi:cytochrome c